ncbi:MAG: hypothetical protein EPO13_08630 [Actinomycetota bacterium]|nr:MAG: hypothetical protein EPO13_08630 [Actinomycetota bacterium]
MTAVPLVSVARPDATFLLAQLDKLAGWDPRAVVRLQPRASALGVFSAPPLGCIAFVAVPAARNDAAPDDVMVGVDDLRAELRAAAGLSPGWPPVPAGSQAEDTVAFEIRPTQVSSPKLALLPPRAGWSATSAGPAASALADVAEAVDEFRAASALVADDAARQDLAERIWGRPGWAELPRRILHAAALLGFLADPGVTVHAAVAGSWQRLGTPAGQVFAHSAGSSLGLLSLSTVR